MRMLKSWLRFTVIGASILALAACGGNQQGADMGTNGYRANATDNGTGMNRFGMHNNRNLRMNEDVARAVERIDGVSRARVVMGDTNVYVAVELDKQTGGNARNNAQNRAGTGGTGGVADLRGTTGNGLIGGVSMHGATGQNGAGGNRASSITDFGTVGDGTRGGGMTGTGLSGRVGTNQTGLIPYGHNGQGNSVGIFGENGGHELRNSNDYDDTYMYNGGAFGRQQRDNNAYGVNSTIRSRVQQVVFSMVPNARRVFVTADETFMQRLGTFGDRIGGDRQNGRGVLNEFNEFVGNVFAAPFGNSDYNLNDGYNTRNRNGVTRQMDNTFMNRNRGGLGEMFDGDGDVVDFSPRQPAGTIGTTR